MPSKIDQVFTLDDQSKYMIVDQGIYQGKNYFLASEVTASGEDLTNHFSVFEEIVVGDSIKVSTVQDKKLLETLFQYFQSRA